MGPPEVEGAGEAERNGDVGEGGLCWKSRVRLSETEDWAGAGEGEGA